MTPRAGMNASQISVVRNTVCRGLNDLEFDHYMQQCENYKLDPLKQQLVPKVLHADQPGRRELMLITTREALRVIAARTGTYRAAPTPPEYLIDPDTKNPKTNPHGIVACTVTCYKFTHGEWHPAVGQVFWDEYFPEHNPEGTGWMKMGRLMIAKCAEVAALRAGWPDEFGGLYLLEEMAAADDNTRHMTATQKLEHAATQKRIAANGGDGILFDLEGGKLESIPIGQLADRIMEATTGMKPDQVRDFVDRNEAGMSQFWTRAPGDALQIKAHLEAASYVPDKL